jgi:hypothetical protein
VAGGGVGGVFSFGEGVGTGVLAGVSSAALGVDSSVGLGDGNARRKGAAASCAEATSSNASVAQATTRTFEIFLKRAADFLAAS